MNRRLVLSTAVAAGAFTLLAACGASSSGAGTNDSSTPPKTELTNAFHSLGDGSALTTTLSLDTTAANIQHIATESGGSGLTTSQASLIAGARIVVEAKAPSGKTLGSAQGAGSTGGMQLSITGTAGGTTYFAVTYLPRTIYLQLDLKDLLAAAGMSSEYQTLVARTASMPAFVQAFIAGKFIALPLSAVSSLTSLLRGYAQSAVPGGIPTGTQITTLVKSVEAAVLGDLTATRSSTGTTDQLAVTANLRSIARDVLSTVSTAIPALGSQIDPSSANGVPDKDLKFDASVTGGALSRLSFDFGQFSPHAKDTLPVVATFAKSGADIAAPSGATPVSFQDLISFFTAIGTATSSTSSGSGSSAPSPVKSTQPAPAQ